MLFGLEIKIKLGGKNLGDKPFNSKKKGSDFERVTAKAFSNWWGVKAFRVPGSGSLHWGETMNVGGDVTFPPEARFPFVIECKKHEGWTLENIILNNKEPKTWWSQVVGDALENHKVPMLVFTRNRAETFVIVPYNAGFECALEDGHTGIYPTITYIEYLDHLKRPLRYTVMILKQSDLFTLNPKSVRGHFSDPYNWENESRVNNRHGEYDLQLEDVEENPEEHIDDLLNRAGL